MPVIRHAGRLFYFAHVPKCAGMAVARYIAARTGPMAFHDSAYLALPEAERWTRTSPQHLTVAAMDRLFPPGFFDARFAVIRHPVDRIAAVYLYQKEKEGSVQAEVAFEDWLDEIAGARETFAYDNHARPMADFVPEDAALFRLEDGLEALKDWLDATLGLAPDPGHPQIPRINTRYRRNGGKVVPFVVSDGARDRIKRLYSRDFERFGYE